MAEGDPLCPQHRLVAGHGHLGGGCAARASAATCASPKSPDTHADSAAGRWRRARPSCTRRPAVGLGTRQRTEIHAAAERAPRSCHLPEASNAAVARVVTASSLARQRCRASMLSPSGSASGAVAHTLSSTASSSSITFVQVFVAALKQKPLSHKGFSADRPGRHRPYPPTASSSFRYSSKVSSSKATRRISSTCVGVERKVRTATRAACSRG